MPSEVIIANTLSPVSFVAGTDQQLQFAVLDSASAIVDLNNCYCFWVMGSILNPTTISASATGSLVSGSSNIFYADLQPSDTSGLQGIFIQQPRIVDVNGKYYIPGQGKVVVFGVNGSG